VKQGCIFCSIIERKIPASIIAETDDVLVIKDIAPQASIHFLLIPKRHVEDVEALSTHDTIAQSLLMMAQTLSRDVVKTKDFRLLINSGSWQHVPHLHMHFLAGTPLSHV
jgi:histidine triad (HIT) family protein